METQNLVSYPDPYKSDIVKALGGQTYRNVVFPKPKLALGGHMTKDPRTLAGYAWGMYGFLAMINCLYYTDYVYRHYVVDHYNYLGLATKSIYGLANFFRSTLHMIVWVLAGLLWALTFTQIPATWVMFKYFTTFLAIFELSRVFIVISMNIVALIFDRWWPENAGGEFISPVNDYNHFKEQMAMGNRILGVGKELRFIKSWDYKLEMLNISAQFVAYPLF